MKKMLPVAGLIVFGLLVIYLIFTVKFVSWDFRNNLWAPAYLITQGKSAYGINLIFNNSNSIWFPQAIGVFFFLGFLPQYLATNIWLISNIALLLIFLGYILRQSNDRNIKPLYLGILTLAVFLYPPTIRHLILGQVDILLTMALIAGIHLLERKHLMLGGLLFALALVKPQNCIVVLPGIFFYILFIKKAARDALKLFLAICFFVVLQTTPLWLSSSMWPYDFLSNLMRNPGWAQPSIFFMLRNGFGTIGYIFWLMIYITVIVINLHIWSKNKPERAILWSLALTAIISPYLWSWDFVLLIPLFIDTAIRLSNSASKLILFTFYVFCLFGVIIALKGGNASDEVLWWLPLLLIIGIAFSLIVNKILRKKQFAIL